MNMFDMDDNCIAALVIACLTEKKAECVDEGILKKRDMNLAMNDYNSRA